jgi:hypothetical protein
VGWSTATRGKEARGQREDDERGGPRQTAALGGEGVQARHEEEAAQSQADENESHVIVWEARNGEFHDQADAKRIVVRRPLRGHNDTHCGWPLANPWLAYWPPGAWLPLERIWRFQLLLINNIIY